MSGSSGRPDTAGLPATMAAAVYREPGVVDVQERPVPTVEPDEVLVEVSHCGICGTDLHMVIDGWGAPGSIGGHEFSGRIVAVGSGVEQWRVGDRIVAEPTPTCGRCDLCRAGRPSLCTNRPAPGPDTDQSGAFAAYTAVDQRRLVRVPQGLGLREAALAEPLAVSLHAISRSGARAGQRVLITGAGPIGVLCVAALREMGVDDITVSEPSPERRRLASAVGAPAVCEPGDLVSFSMAEPARTLERPFDVVLECSGKKSAVEAAPSQLRRGGTLVLVGTGIDPPKFDTNRIILCELTITGAFEYDAGGFTAALEMLAGGSLPLDLLIEPDAVPLSGMLDAMVGLTRGDIAGKVLVSPR